jgi:hypothetical protein
MPTPPGFADVSLKLVLDGFIRPAYITFGVDPTMTDPQQVAQAVYGVASNSTSLNGKLDSNVTWAECIARLGTDGGEDLIGNFVGTAKGISGGGAPPPNVAVLIHKRTARGGRRGRGRLYMPWWCSDNDTNEDGTILPNIVTALQTAAEQFRTQLGAAGVPMVLLHSQGLTTPGPPDPVTQLAVSNVVGTQRRRIGR